MGAIELLKKRLVLNGSGPFPDRYHYQNPDGSVASVDCNGERTSKVTTTYDANESIIWDGKSDQGYFWPHPQPFDNLILVLINTEERFNG